MGFLVIPISAQHLSEQRVSLAWIQLELGEVHNVLNHKKLNVF
jgi:hypothetical protein